jgi:hypothetical protein
MSRRRRNPTMNRQPPAPVEVGNTTLDNAIEDILAGAKRLSDGAPGGASSDWPALVKVSADVWARCQEVQKHVRNAEVAIMQQMREHMTGANKEARVKERGAVEQESDAERRRLDEEDEALVRVWSQERADKIEAEKSQETLAAS